MLTRFGCNSGPCHGKARGQNGFQLSLLGFDRDFDFAALTQEAKGRRVFREAPDHSLLLRKASGQMPHGGGKKFTAHSEPYNLLRRWIVEGTPRRVEGTPSLVRIAVAPTERIMTGNTSEQLKVTAFYSDGTTRDVTALTTFQSNESGIVAVNDNGLVQAGPLPGEAAIMARFMEKFAVCQVAIPLSGSVPAEVYGNLPRNNFIDGHVWDKLQKFGITPSERADDATFQRRVYLDLIGRLPTPAEVKAFLADQAADRRTKLIDRLLERPSMPISGPTSGPTCSGRIPIASASKRSSTSMPGSATPFAATYLTTSSSANC